MPVPPGSTKARKPTHLKILKGSFRPSLANALEPKLPAEIPHGTEHLDADEKEAWTYYAELLGRFRVVTRKTDRVRAPRVLPRRGPRAQAVIRKQATEGDTDPTYETRRPKRTAMLRVKPIFAALAEAESRLRDWLGRFGLTPADRSRVTRRAKMAKAKSGKRTSSPKRATSSDPHVAKASPTSTTFSPAGSRRASSSARLASASATTSSGTRTTPSFYWDEDLAGRACRFIECLPHIEGPKAFTRRRHAEHVRA
jgi:hypothetical protein